MGLFGNKFKKIKRTEVVDTICTLEQQQQEMLDEIGQRKKEIAALYVQGKNEKARDMQIYYAKKIQNLEQQNAAASKRLQFMNSNITALMQLKGALDDREFVQNNSKLPLNQLLNSPKELHKFLSEITHVKMQQEGNLEQTMEVFDSANEGYVESERLYGVDEQTNNILAMFETEKQLDDEMRIVTGEEPAEEAPAPREEPQKAE